MRDIKRFVNSLCFDIKTGLALLSLNKNLYPCLRALLGVLFISLHAIAQNEKSLSQEVDSLHKMLLLTKNDSSRINILNTISYTYYEKGDYDQSLKYILEVFKQGKDINFKKGIAVAHNNTGLIHEVRGNYKAAIKEYTAALTLYKEIDNTIGISNSYNNLGVIYEHNGNYDGALEYYEKALKIKEVTQMRSGIASAYNNIANIHNLKGRYVEAIDYYLKSVNLYVEIGRKDGAARSYANVGNVYYVRKNYDNALEYYNKALQLNEELGSKKGMANDFSNIGIIYDVRGNYEEAIQYYTKALIIYEELRVKKGMARTLNNIAIVYDLKSDNEMALKYYLRSLKMQKELNSRKGIAINLNNLGEFYQKQKDANIALSYYHESLEISKEIGFNYLTQMLHKNVSDSYKFLRKYKPAYENHIAYLTYKDSIFSEEKSNAIGRIEGLHEMELLAKQQKEEELENKRIADEQKLRRNNIQYSIISIAIIFVFIAVFFIGRFSLPNWAVQLAVFLPILLVFELILVFFDSFIEAVSGGQPLYKLLINAILVGLIFPIHQLIEKHFLTRIGKVKGDASLAKKSIKTPKNFMILFLPILMILNFSGLTLYKPQDETAHQTENPEVLAYGSESEFQKLMELANQLKKTASVDSAIDLMTKCAQIAENQLDTINLALALSSLGQQEMNRTNYEKSLKFFFRAINLYQRVGDIKGEASSLNNTGEVYRKLKQDSKALSNYNRALPLFENVSDSNSVAKVLNNIGIIYVHKNDLDSALYYYSKSLSIQEKLQNDQAIAGVLGNIAIVYFHKGRKDSSIFFFEKTVNIFKRVGDEKGRATALKNIGNIYFEEQEYKQALEPSLTAFKIRYSIRDKLGLMTSSQMVSDIFALLDQFDSALHYSNLYELYRDSIFNDQKAKEIGKIEAKHEFQLKSLELEKHMEAEKRKMVEIGKRNNDLQYSGILIGIFLLFIIVFLLGSMNLPKWAIEFSIFLLFLLAFEFLLVYVDPYIESFSKGEPAWKLIANACIAIFIFPIHKYFEKMMHKRLHNQ